MPRESSAVVASRERRLVLFRTVGVGLGIVLTAVALWLIVTSTTQKSLEIGVLLGIWGVVIAASCAFGNRVHHQGGHAETAAAEQVDGTGDELTLRSKNEVSLAAELTERRKFQAQLEQLLRTELRNVLVTEVEGLRAEVADLRREFLDSVGGRLQLERVETTRVIGSNLESMHQELQRLTADEPAAERETVDAEVVEDDSTQQPSSADEQVGSSAEEAEQHPTSAATVPSSRQSPAPSTATVGRRRGGRRRAENADNDVLARVLARERRT